MATPSSRSARRRLFAAASTIVLAVAACGTSTDIDSALPEGSLQPGTTATTTAVSPASSPASTEPSEVVEATDSEPAPPHALDEGLGLDQSEFALPTGLFIENLAIGEHMVAAAWMEGAGQVLWRVGDGTEDATSLEALFAGAAVDGEPIFMEISDVVAFDGRYFAFVMGDPEADERSPTVIVSDDGQSWSRSPTAIVSGSPTNVARTPDSPPYPGASAVVDAIVVRDRLYATGWATIDGEIRTAVWDSADGENWRLDVVPQLAYNSEYGSQIGRSDAGTILRIGGPIHTGVATMISTNRGEWMVAPTIDDSASPQLVGTNDLFFYNLVRSFEGPSILRVSDESAEEWENVELPFSATSDQRLFFNASSWHDPVVVIGAIFTGHDTDPMRLWTLDRGTWEPSHIDGDRLVSIDACFITTADEDTLYRFDRSHNGQC